MHLASIHASISGTKTAKYPAARSWTCAQLLQLSARDQLVPECACKQQTQQLQQLVARNVRAHARRNKGGGKQGKGDVAPQPAAAATTTANAAGLLRALEQLASRTTIMLGSHQAYAILESLELQLPQQLPHVDTDLLASGLWAMARLQLQPQQELIAAVAAYLMQPDQQVIWLQHKVRGAGGGAGAAAGQAQMTSRRNSSSSSSSSRTKCSDSPFLAAALCTRLAGCSTRSFGTFCYSLNFFLLRDPSFWATAAAVSLQQLQQLKSANISNLLQGLALSGWVLDPGALGPQQVSTSRLKVETQLPQQQQQQQQREQGTAAVPANSAAAAAEEPRTAAIADVDGGRTTTSSSSSSKVPIKDGAGAVLALLTALEASLISQPSQLRLWRLRDISQLAQAYALIGFRCGPLFAIIAQHLLEYTEPVHEQLQAQAQQQQSLQQQQQQQNAALSRQQQESNQQQQRPAWSAPNSSVMFAAYPDGHGSSSSSSSGPGLPGSQGVPAAAGTRQLRAKSWHDKGRGPARLAACRACDAVGLAWAYVHSFCPNQMLLCELAAVLTQKAPQLHAADVSRLLWAYATAKVVDWRMLSAVTSAVVEEMHGVLPRTAAGSVWALGMMRHQAPAFLEAAFDRLAACLEVTPIQLVTVQQQQQQQQQQQRVNMAHTFTAAAETVSDGPVAIQQGAPSPGAAAVAAEAAVMAAVPAVAAGTAGAQYAVQAATSAMPAAAASNVSGAADVSERPSMLQQLYQGSGASSSSWLSGGPQVHSEDLSRNPPEAHQGEYALMRSLTQQQQTTGWQQQLEAGDDRQQQQQQQPRFEGAASRDSGNGTGPNAQQLLPPLQQQQRQQQQQPVAPPQQQHQQQWVNPAVAAWPSQQQHQQQNSPTYPQQTQQQQSAVRVTHRDVSEAVWAAGRLQHYNAAFFSVLRPRLRGLLPGFTDTQLVDLLWGLARLELYDAPNTDAAAEELIQRAPRLQASGLALSAWVYAHLRHGHSDLFSALSARAVQLAAEDRLVPKDARQLLYAAAKLGVRDRALMKACGKVLKSRMHNAGISLVVSSMWGAAVAGHFDEDLFAGGILFLNQQPLKVLKPLWLLQIFQATTLLKDALGPASELPVLQLSPQLAAAVQRQWLTTTRRSPVSRRGSGFAADVARVLRHQLGRRVRGEARTSDGLFSIDLALTWNGRQVAVEVDGPDHFTRNAPYTMLGSSTAKHSCLQARGWAVLSVPFYEWNEITARFLPTPTFQGSSESTYTQQGSYGQQHVLGRRQLFQHPHQQQQQQQQQQTPMSGSEASGDGVPSLPPAAARDAKAVEVAVAAAQSVGVPADLALQLAAARAEYLQAALVKAVECAQHPRLAGSTQPVASSSSGNSSS